MHTTHAQLPGLGCRVLQRDASRQSSGPGIITAPRPSSDFWEGCVLAPSSQSLQELFQGWEGLPSWSSCLGAQASPHPHPLGGSTELKGPIVGPWRWGVGKEARAVSCRTFTLQEGLLIPLGPCPHQNPQEPGPASAGAQDRKGLNLGVRET